MPLNQIQQAFYDHAVTIYRANKADVASNGDLRWRAMYAGVPCKPWTSTNFDRPVGSFAQHKEANLETANRCDFCCDVDVQDQDVLLFTYGGNVGPITRYFQVSGDPQTRTRQPANLSRVRLVPTPFDVKNIVGGSSGPSIQDDINATGSGDTYTFPSVATITTGLTIPNGVSLAPAVGGSILYGSVLVNPAPLLNTDPNYSSIPLGTRSRCYVIDMAGQGYGGLLAGLETTMKGGNNSCSTSIPKLFCDDAPMAFARYPSSPYTGPTAIYAVSTSTNGANAFTDTSLPNIVNNSLFAQSYIGGEGTDFYDSCTVSGQTVTWSDNAPQTVENQSRYWLFNVLNFLLLPGQFFIDTTLWRLYFIPPDNNAHIYRVSVCSGDMVAITSTSTAAQIGNATDVLAIRHGNNTGLSAGSSSSNIALGNVQIVGCGQAGFNLGNAASSFTQLATTQIFAQYNGWSGLILGGGGNGSTSLTLSENNLNIYLDSNCQQCRSTSGQFRDFGIGNTINGTITNSVNQAFISQGSRLGTFTFIIDTAMQEGGDGGAFYCDADPCMFGNVGHFTIKKLPADLVSAKTEGGARRGIYVDDCASGWTFINPTGAHIYTQQGVIFFGGGRALTVTGAGFLDCPNGSPFQMDDRGSPWTNYSSPQYNRWDYTSLSPLPAVQSYSKIANNVTLGLPAGHGYFVGDVVTVANVGGVSNVNGTHTVTARTAASISFAAPTASGAYTSGGTVAIGSNGEYYTIWLAASNGGAFAQFGMPFTDMLSNNLGTPQHVSYACTHLPAGNAPQIEYSTSFMDAPITQTGPLNPGGLPPVIPATPGLPVQPQPQA
jgi:hypothetical protein